MIENIECKCGWKDSTSDLLELIINIIYIYSSLLNTAALNFTFNIRWIVVRVDGFDPKNVSILNL